MGEWWERRRKHHRHNDDFPSALEVAYTHGAKTTPIYNYISMPYSYVADPDLLRSGLVVTKFRMKLLSFQDLEGRPAPLTALAILTGIPLPRLSEYANGKRRIPPHNVRRICQVLKCPPDEIIGTVELS